MIESSPLGPAQRRILTLLLTNKPNFVPGKDLAKAGGIPIAMLSGWMAAIRRAHPELMIGSKIGSGYRIVEAASAAPETIRAVVEPRPAKAPSRGPGLPLNVRMAANMAIIDLLPAKTAELVKVIALEAGEDIDATLHRLISYGVEVHNDLVLAGENPVGLRRRPLGQRGAERVWQ